MITKDTVVTGRSIADLTQEQFTAILGSMSSPALVDSETSYRAIAGLGVSPALILAIFMQESLMGTVGLARANRSPGNTRSVMPGNKGQPVTTTKGIFIKYPSWFDGFKDLAQRLVQPGYDYDRAKARTIGRIIPIFAPTSDGNSPDIYIANVVFRMNQWISGSMESSSMEIIDLTANTPGEVFTARLLPISEVVLHETSGPPDKNSNSLEAVKLANANTIRWFQGAATTGVSIHYYIGPEKMGAPIYRLCNENMAAYHAIGNKGFYVNASKDNHMSIGIERFGYPTEPVGPNQKAALLRLVADIAARRGLDPEQIISHASIQSDRTDGRILLEACRDAVRNGGINNVSSESTNKPTIVTFPNGKAIGGGFLEYFNTYGGIKFFGLPLTEEQTNPKTNLTEQVFERYVLEYDKNEPNPDWKVRGKIIGNTYLKERGF